MITDTYLQKVEEEFTTSEFWSFIGLEIQTLKEGYVELRLPYKKEFNNVRSTVHGGIYMSAIDTTMGMMCRSLGYDDVMTIQLSTQFLKPVVGEAFTTSASVIHRSKSTILVEGKMCNEAGELIGHSTATFRVIKYVN